MANVADGAVRIEGLTKFVQQMGQLAGPVSRKVIRTSLNDAALLVAHDAQRRAPVRSGNLRASIRPMSTANYARITEGSSKVPYAGFIDYGGTVGRYRKGAIHQSARKAKTARFFAVRPFIRTGRILFPAFLAQKNAVLTQLNTNLREAMQEIGLVVTG